MNDTKGNTKGLTDFELIQKYEAGSLPLNIINIMCRVASPSERKKAIGQAKPASEPTLTLANDGLAISNSDSLSLNKSYCL